MTTALDAMRAALDALSGHEWTFTDDRYLQCYWCDARPKRARLKLEEMTSGKRPGRRAHRPDCAWVDATDKLRAAIAKAESK